MNVKQSTLFLAAAAVTILNFESCKKYEDGPAFSLRSKKARLTGEWELVKINGQNPNEYLSNNSGYSYYNRVITNFSSEWEFEDDNDFSRNTSYTETTSYTNWYGNTYTNYNNFNSSETGDWDWEDNKEDIEIRANGVISEYEILKLTNEELKLEYGGAEFEFEK